MHTIDGAGVTGYTAHYGDAVDYAPFSYLMQPNHLILSPEQGWPQRHVPYMDRTGKSIALLTSEESVPAGDLRQGRNARPVPCGLNGIIKLWYGAGKGSKESDNNKS